MSSLLALGAFFMLTSQAFANYWFLIAGLCSIAMCAGGHRQISLDAGAGVRSGYSAGRNTS
jgi:hypothetical protein